MVKAIVTVVGHDRVGIIAAVSNVLAQNKVNILDLSQTVASGYFTMIMLVDVGECESPFTELRDKLDELGRQMKMSIRIQHEDIFNAMNNI